jgi:hypothetical protein
MNASVPTLPGPLKLNCTIPWVFVVPDTTAFVPHRSWQRHTPPPTFFASVLNRQPLHATHFHHRQPIVYPSLVEHAMDMVAHGLLGKA